MTTSKTVLPADFEENDDWFEIYGDDGTAVINFARVWGKKNNHFDVIFPFQKASVKLRGNKQRFVLKVIELVWNFDLGCLSAQLLDDEDIFYKIKGSWRYWDNQDPVVVHASDRLLDNKRFVLKMVGNLAAFYPGRISILQYASERLCDDNDVVMAAIEGEAEEEPGDGEMEPFSPLQFASDRLKDHQRTVLVAFVNSPVAIRHASNRIRNDVAFWREVLTMELVLERWDSFIEETDGDHFLDLRHCPPSFYNDRDIVLKLVSQDGRILEHVSPRMKDDREVVYKAVCGVVDDPYIPIYVRSSLEHASERLRDDKSLVMSAVFYDGLNLEHASERLRNDWDVAVNAVRRSNDEPYYRRNNAWEFIHPELRQNKSLAMIYVSHGIQYDGNDVWRYIKRESRMNQVAHFKSDREVVSTAISNDWTSIRFASVHFQKDPQMVLLALTSGKTFVKKNQAFRLVFEVVFKKFQEIHQMLSLHEDHLLDGLFPYNKKNGDLKLKGLKRTPQKIDVETWRRSKWEIVWLVGNLMASHHSGSLDTEGLVVNGSEMNMVDSSRRLVLPDVLRNVLEFTGLPATMELYTELKDWEEVFNRFLEMRLTIPTTP